MHKPYCSVTREWLYDLVWSFPLEEAAKQLEFSSSRLSKACKTMEIPCPTNGYWMKLRAGKQLVPRKKRQQEHYYTGREHWSPVRVTLCRVGTVPFIIQIFEMTDEQCQSGKLAFGGIDSLPDFEANLEANCIPSNIYPLAVSRKIDSCEVCWFEA